MTLKILPIFRFIVASLTILVVGCSYISIGSHSLQKVKFEIRLAHHVPTPNCQEMELYGTKHKVYVESDSHFSNSDIEFAKAEIPKEYNVMKETVITLKLTNDASKKFTEFTKENYNKPIAIIFDGKVMSTPIIRETITTGVIYFTGRFSLEEAQMFVERLNRN